MSDSENNGQGGGCLMSLLGAVVGGATGPLLIDVIGVHTSQDDWIGFGAIFELLMLTLLGAVFGAILFYVFYSSMRR